MIFDACLTKREEGQELGLEDALRLVLDPVVVLVELLVVGRRVAELVRLDELAAGHRARGGDKRGTKWSRSS